ncbi:MAG: hypothetical protein E7015_03890 [Alphaproteobacteria bacterium]|nr:hypothetical protein [Alphaproteobacteria bacterium]
MRKILMVSAVFGLCCLFAGVSDLRGMTDQTNNSMTMDNDDGNQVMTAKQENIRRSSKKKKKNKAKRKYGKSRKGKQLNVQQLYKSVAKLSDEECEELMERLDAQLNKRKNRKSRSSQNEEYSEDEQDGANDELSNGDDNNDQFSEENNEDERAVKKQKKKKMTKKQKNKRDRKKRKTPKGKRKKIRQRDLPEEESTEMQARSSIARSHKKDWRDIVAKVDGNLLSFPKSNRGTFAQLSTDETKFREELEKYRQMFLRRSDDLKKEA